MNKQEVIRQLKNEYPGKKIILNDKNNPTEIICEIDPSSVHPDYSVAIAVVDRIKPHYHKKTTEIYGVIKGSLTLFVDNQETVLNTGESLTIKPLSIHHANGKETWIKASSSPGWTIQDHLTM